MSEEEILKLWYEGISRITLAKMYQNRYNQNVKLIRFDIRNRHVKLISYKEALNKIEIILMKEVRKQYKRRNIKQ